MAEQIDLTDEEAIIWQRLCPDRVRVSLVARISQKTSDKGPSRMSATHPTTAA